MIVVLVMLLTGLFIMVYGAKVACTGGEIDGSQIATGLLTLALGVSLSLLAIKYSTVLVYDSCNQWNLLNPITTPVVST